MKFLFATFYAWQIISDDFLKEENIVVLGWLRQKFKMLMSFAQWKTFFKGFALRNFKDIRAHLRSGIIKIWPWCQNKKKKFAVGTISKGRKFYVNQILTSSCISRIVPCMLIWFAIENWRVHFRVVLLTEWVHWIVLQILDIHVGAVVVGGTAAAVIVDYIPAIHDSVHYNILPGHSMVWREVAPENWR